jgi:dephospho-CoA kinase
MIKVALVGNIASGKSTVEKLLSELGYQTLDSDKVCHDLLQFLPEVKETFRDYDVFLDGEISREKLGKLVFRHEDLRKTLENILYPQLLLKIEEFFSGEQDVGFVSVPLLFEAGMENMFDKIVFIYCDDENRLARLISRNGYTKEYATTRMNAQLPQDEKLKKSDFVIYNNSSLEELKNQVKILLEQIR